MKNLSKEDKYIQQFISELGTDRPSAGFHKSILEKLNPKQTLTVYRPVISPLAWKLIGSGIAALVICVLLFLPGGENSTPLMDQVPKISIPQVAISFPKVSLPDIDLSPIVIQSLVVFILLAILSAITTLKNLKTS
ncbi:hypothetical protein J2X69_002720 [Algoriphagus sp. 4150]|uniref:hypothetical protein n=1 Tax=Algoriphagus sp. 4150 TaxID=2817756 RepID=UPI0028615ACD|nr:hypothetical protein [Algoriphagus sp. 4150]MDR7130370.1 hypothetical protein [Algoriphagus sp. 4150]